MTDTSGFVVKTLRMHTLESTIIDQACAALQGVSRAALMKEGASNEAARLGIGFGQEMPPPLKTSWPYLPERGDEPTGVRISITMTLAEAELVSRAAEHTHSSEPRFIIGATLAYIGRLQKTLRVIHAATPERAAAIRKSLERIKLPVQYRCKSLSP